MEMKNTMLSSPTNAVICQLLWLLICIEGFTGASGFEFKRGILCESLTGFVSCLRPNDYVLVKQARYGRWLPYPRICGEMTGRPPCSVDTTAIVLPFCYHTNNCSFPNTDAFFGQPCTVARQGKYLGFDYACVPEDAIYPVCGPTSSIPVPLPLPEQGLLAPPFYTPYKDRPWRCDVRISGAASMTFEVINDDNGRVPVMACGRNIFVGELVGLEGCRPLSKDENYTTRGDVNIYFYNTNDTGPQALVYYQVIQKDVLGILTAARNIHPVAVDEPSTIFPWLVDMSTEVPLVKGTTIDSTETTYVEHDTTLPEWFINSTVTPDVTTDNNTRLICNTSISLNTTNVNGTTLASNSTDGNVTITCFYVTAPTIGDDTTDIDSTDKASKVTSPNTESTTTRSSVPEKTEPPLIRSGNQIPVNNSSKASNNDGKVGSIPAYLVGIIVAVLGFIILILIIAFIVAMCKRRDRVPHEDMTALSQDRERSREMNIYSTIDLHEEGSMEKPPIFAMGGTGKKNKEDTIEKAKSAAKEDKGQGQTNSSFSPTEIWYEDKVDFVLY